MGRPEWGRHYDVENALALLVVASEYALLQVSSPGAYRALEQAITKAKGALQKSRDYPNQTKKEQALGKEAEG